MDRAVSTKDNPRKEIWKLVQRTRQNQNKTFKAAVQSPTKARGAASPLEKLTGKKYTT
jgi:hypothetical protein